MASFSNWNFKVYAKISTGDSVTLTGVSSDANEENMYNAISALAAFKSGEIENIFLQEVAEILN